MIEYIDSCHTYLSDGVIIPSVSALVAFATGEDYSSVPRGVLKKAQDFGTDLHQAIQDYYEKDIKTEFKDVQKQLCFEQFLLLQPLRNPKCEVMVDYKGYYAGRLDLLDDDNLVDIKTNSIYPEEHLRWQLQFYAIALKSKGIEVNRFHSIWLPKGKMGRYLEVKPHTVEECFNVLSAFYKNEYEKYIAI